MLQFLTLEYCRFLKVALILSLRKFYDFDFECLQKIEEPRYQIVFLTVHRLHMKQYKNGRISQNLYLAATRDAHLRSMFCTDGPTTLVTEGGRHPTEFRGTE